MNAAAFDRLARALHVRLGRRAAIHAAAAALIAPTAANAAGKRDRATATRAVSTQALSPAAVHRHGQTFVTWSERADLTGESYRIYRHSAPITSGNLAQATLLAEVGKGSNLIWTDRYKHGGDSYDWQWRYLDRAVITDNGSPLPATTGLLVWTPNQADITALGGGNASYAVVTVPAAGAPSAPESATPVAETVSDPRAILARTAEGGAVRVYLQFMNLREWNPTFHAPRDNAHLGLDENDPRIPHALAYAYTYVVAGPNPAYCPGGTVPARIPAYVRLHGWSDDSNSPDLSTSPYWCAYEIRPIDTAQTWWFGFAEDCDYRTGATPANGDRVPNYTEERVLRMVDDLLHDPDLGATVDPERLYVYGASMGGSGTLAFALRYPRTFAAAYAGEPMTNYATSGDGGGLDWRTDVDWKWGAIGRDLPILTRARNGWGDHLARYDGTGVWTWQDHTAQLLDRRRDDMIPFGIAHGLQDDVIEWPTQGRPFYASLEQSGQVIGGRTIDMGHSWTGFNGLPHNLDVDNSLQPFAAMTAILSET
ncbi:MAG: prolyl oligopeptidase family serine peptidase, partial [Thermomicrobiales bacterium]